MDKQGFDCDDIWQARYQWAKTVLSEGISFAPFIVRDTSVLLQDGRYVISFVEWDATVTPAYRNAILMKTNTATWPNSSNNKERYISTFVDAPGRPHRSN